MRSHEAPGPPAVKFCATVWGGPRGPRLVGRLKPPLGAPLGSFGIHWRVEQRKILIGLTLNEGRALFSAPELTSVSPWRWTLLKNQLSFLIDKTNVGWHSGIDKNIKLFDIFVTHHKERNMQQRNNKHRPDALSGQNQNWYKQRKTRRRENLKRNNTTKQDYTHSQKQRKRLLLITTPNSKLCRDNQQEWTDTH